MAGLCSLKELQNGTYGLKDLLDLNEALDLKAHVEHISMTSGKKQNIDDDTKLYRKMMAGKG